MERAKITQMLVGLRTLGQFIHGDTHAETRERARWVLDALDSNVFPEQDVLSTHIPAVRALLQGLIYNPCDMVMMPSAVQIVINMYVEVIDDCISSIEEITR